MRIGFLIGLGVAVSLAQAGQITDRTALQTLLGGPGTTENFEAFTIGAGAATTLDCAVLDSSAICNGQGPGLVVSGVRFVFATSGQWDGAGYYGAPSRELLSNGQPFDIGFTTPVSAFGVDLRAFSGYNATATMSVYAGNDTTLIGTLSNIALGSDGVPVFAGWSDPSGIGRIELTQTSWSWSPIIDNLEFGGTGGGAVPEPACGALVLAGLACLGLLRKRI